MFRSLKALFDDGIARLTSHEASIDDVPLAVAALLLEIARADHTVDATERQAVITAIAQICKLADADIETLVATAAEAVDESVSFYDFTTIANERLSRAQKVQLLEMLWKVAHADGRVDHYEEYYIRKLADLLHLSHGDFIRTKLAATAS